MTTLAFIGGGAAIMLLLVWFLMRKAKKEGRLEQVERNRKAEANVRKKQDAVKPKSDKSVSDSLRKGKF